VSFVRLTKPPRFSPVGGVRGAFPLTLSVLNEKNKSRDFGSALRVET